MDQSSTISDLAISCKHQLLHEVAKEYITASSQADASIVWGKRTGHNARQDSFVARRSAVGGARRGQRYGDDAPRVCLSCMESSSSQGSHSVSLWSSSGYAGRPGAFVKDLKMEHVAREGALDGQIVPDRNIGQLYSDYWWERCRRKTTSASRLQVRLSKSRSCLELMWDVTIKILGRASVFSTTRVLPT